MGALAHDAVVVRRAGGLEVHAGGLAEVVEPVQHVLVFLGADDLVGQAGGPAHGHQQEDVPGGRADALAQIEDVLEAVQVVARDRGVDLEGHPGLFKVFDAAHRGFEGPGHAAELVVAGGVGAIDGDGAAVDAGFLDLAGQFGRDQGAVGREGAGQPLVVGIGHQFIDIGAHHGIAAGEDDDGVAHLGEGVDEGLGLFGGELARIGFRVGLGAAVLAGQVTGAGHFPGDELAGGRAVLKGAHHLVAGRAPGMTAGMGTRGTGMAAGVSPHAAGMARHVLLVMHQRTSLCLSRVSVK